MVLRLTKDLEVADEDDESLPETSPPTLQNPPEKHADKVALISSKL